MCITVDSRFVFPVSRDPKDPTVIFRLLQVIGVDSSAHRFVFESKHSSDCLKKTVSSSEMPLPSLSPLFLLFLTPKAWSYEAPEDKQDVFARTACPAFLTFTNAAYLSGVTVELPCLCKPEQVEYTSN